MGSKSVYTSKTCRLLSMLVLTSGFFLVEIVVGYVTNSIALVADSFHMLSDVVALIVGFSCVRIAKWPSKRNTFGWIRAEVLGALVNAVFLLALCFSILVEALKRLVEVEEIKDPKLLLIVGAAGLLVNIIGLFLFHDHGHSHGGHSHGNEDEKPEHEALVETKSEPNGHAHIDRDTSSIHSHTHSHDVTIEEDSPKLVSSAQLNMRGVFLHVLGDALGSVIVIVSALVIWFAEGQWRFYVDPAMSIMLVMIILGTTIPLLKESAMILLLAVPTHIRTEQIRQKVEKIKGVIAVHEFHVWQLAGNRIIASAHVRCLNLKEYMIVAVKIKDLFHEEGIHSTTIQPEFVEHIEFEDNIDNDLNCILECGPNKKCYPDTCCGTRKMKQNGRGSSPKSSHSPSQSHSEPSGSGTSDTPAIAASQSDEFVLPITSV